MMANKNSVNIYFDEDKWEKLKELARARGMSASALVRQLVYEYIAKHNKK
jgi:predicted DNA-binding ribbon-helix-helix protein